MNKTLKNFLSNRVLLIILVIILVLGLLSLIVILIISKIRGDIEDSTTTTNKKIVTNDTLQFNNLSNKDVWIVFTLTGDNAEIIKQYWTFKIDDSIAQGKLVTNGTHLYYGPIKPGSSLYSNYSKEGIPNWISGKCSVLPIEPPENVDMKGLTSLEWTFNDTGTLNPDISALDGINIKVDMELVGNTTCTNPDKSGKFHRQCMLDIHDTKYDEYRKKANPNINIPSIMRMEYPNNKETIKYRGKDGENGEISKCGTENGNCVECATGHDKCACPGGPPCVDDPEFAKKGLKARCYYESNLDKWGCYKWWNDPTNPVSSKWLDIFKKEGGCPNSYRWVYDETTLQNYDPKKHANMKLWDEVGKWEDSVAYKCSQGELSGSVCDGYIVKNKSEVNINCDRTTRDTKLIFNIYDILT